MLGHLPMPDFPGVMYGITVTFLIPSLIDATLVLR